MKVFFEKIMVRRDGGKSEIKTEYSPVKGDVVSQMGSGDATSATSAISDVEYAIYMAILRKDSADFVVLDKSGIQDFGDSNDNFLSEIFKGNKWKILKQQMTWIS
jgi:hypothetical protein